MIWLAIAKELARSGFDVAINSSRTPEEGRAAANEIKKTGRRCIYIHADISDQKQAEEMIERTVNEFGRIDVLVNNAGITLDKKLENMEVSEWNKVLSINLTGTFNCTRTAIRHMQRQGTGKIINISSVVGETGNIGQANYAASKGGIISFTKTVAKEYAKDGITVNAVAPGFVRTQMTDKIPKGIARKITEQIPLGRFGKPEEVAKVVRFLASDDASYITGQVININGGLYM